MSDQDKPEDGTLVQAGRRDLAPAAAVNSLVSRGLADLAQGRLLKVGEKIQSPMKMAFICLCLGMIDEAIRLFDEALSLNPDHSFGYLLRGKAWFCKIRAISDNSYCDNAIRNFSDAIRIEPEYISAYEERGYAWYFKEEYDKAIKDFDEAIRLHSAADFGNLDPDEDKEVEASRASSMAKIYHCRGKAWGCKGDYDIAIADYDEAIHLDPKCAFAYNDRAHAWAAKKDYDKAIKDYDEAIRLAPDEPVYYSNRGHAWEAKNNREKAVNDFDKADRLDRRKRTLPVPRSLEINLPGVLSVLFNFTSASLVETPGLIAISPTTLSEAHAGRLSERQRRLQTLRDFNAPEIIIQNVIRMLRRLEGVWQNGNDKPEDYAYRFKANEEHFESSEFEKALVQFSALTQLEGLDLTECSISDDGLERLQVLPNLRWLDLSNCEVITDQGLANLAPLTGLEYLDLAGCSVTDAGLAHLAGLKNLRYLNFEGCDKISHAQVSALKAALPQCEID